MEYVKLGWVDEGAGVQRTQKSDREFQTGLGRDSMKGQDENDDLLWLLRPHDPEALASYSLCALLSPATTKWGNRATQERVVPPSSPTSLLALPASGGQGLPARGGSRYKQGDEHRLSCRSQTDWCSCLSTDRERERPGSHTGDIKLTNHNLCK